MLALLGAFTLKARAQTGNVCQTPIEITALPYDDAGNTSAYGDDYENADVPPLAPNAVTTGTGSNYYITGDDVVYAYTPAFNGAITITTTNDDDWIGLWAFTGCPFASTVGYHTAISGASRAINGLPVQEGVTYYIVISTWAAPQSTQYTLHVELDWSAEPCTETPAPGATTGPSNICPAVNFTLGLENGTNNNGISYQWETSTDGTTWANAPGNSTEATYSTSQSADTWYRCQVTCDVAGTGTSTPLHVVTNPATECYCTPTGSANNSDEIRNFTLADLNNDSGPSEGTAGYADYTDSIPPVQLIIGTAYTASLTSGTGSGNHGAAIWIDLNDNGQFEPAEMVASIASSIQPNTTASFPAFTAANAPGVHRLRVQYTYIQDGAGLDPCTITTSFAETEDYLVEFYAPAPCSTTPDPGPTTGPAAVCPEEPFTLGITNTTTDSGISYQWETSADGTTWANAPGNGTGPTYATSLTASTWYRCQMACDAAGTGISTALHVEAKPATECYCEPVFSTVEPICSVTFSDLDNPSDPTVGGSPAVEDFTNLAANVYRGNSYSLLVKGNTNGNFTNFITAHFDWDADGVFEMTYNLGPITNDVCTAVASVSITVPADAAVATTHMRITKNYNSSANDPCGSYLRGQAEDYTLHVHDPAETVDCMGVPGGPALPGTPCVSDNGYGGLWSNNCICIENVGIGEIAAATGVALHPNPASTVLYITTPSGLPVHAKVYDMLGQLVVEKDRTVQLDIRHLAPGAYNLQLLDNNGTVKASARFLKQ